MKKKTYLKALARALRGVPAREREDLVSYYDELIEDLFEQGKSPREVFAELEPPEKVAENYLRDLAPESGADEKRGYHVRRKPSLFARILFGTLAAVATTVLASLILAFAASALALAVAGVYILAVSFGLLFAGHAALFFAQIGMAVSSFALGMLFDVLTLVLARLLAGMWRLVTGSGKRSKPMKKGVWRIAIAGGAMLLAGGILFTACFGALRFDSQKLAVGEGIAVHGETLDISDALSLQADNFSVAVKRSEDETCKLVYRDFPESPRRFAFENGKATLGSGDQIFSASFELQWRRGIFIGLISEDLHEAELYLPASFSGKLDVQVATGSISVADLECSELVAETKTGEVCLDKVTAETVSATTKTGAIELKDVTGTRVSVSTATGAIELKDVAGTRVSASTSTGAIEISGLDADDISLRTSTGSVGGTILGSEADYTVEVEVGTGACNLHDRQGGEKRLEVRVGTGSIDIKFLG